MGPLFLELVVPPQLHFTKKIRMFSFELHASTNSTQKVKLIGRFGKFTSTLPLTFRLRKASNVEIRIGYNYFI